jgi:uncharacterized membrane protein YfcA
VEDGTLGVNQIVLAGLIFFSAHLVSTVSGFGSNVLGLPLLALVVGLEPGKQSLIVLGAFLYTYMTLRWWKHVDVAQLIWIVIVAGAGLVIGMRLIAIIPKRGGALLLGAFVIAVGLRGLFKVAPRYKSPMWLRQSMLLLGGVVHGAFTTGGPLLTVYCHRAMPGKSTFRATLAVMWLVLAIGLMIGWTVSGTWHPATPRLTMVGFPFLVAGLIVGEWLHHRVDERAFAGLVNGTLVAVGAVLVWSAR